MMIETHDPPWLAAAVAALNGDYSAARGALNGDCHRQHEAENTPSFVDELSPFFLPKSKKYSVTRGRTIKQLEHIPVALQII